MAVLDQFEHDGIEAIRVGRWDRVNTACIVYRIGDSVIDTGPSNQWRHVRRYLQEFDIKRAFLTHHHEDHSGNCKRIAKKLGAQVYAHEAGIEPLRNGFRMPMLQRVVWGSFRRFEAAILDDYIELVNRRLQVIHTPGHAPDMVCYLDPDHGILFTGDLYITSRPRMLRADENPNEEIKSLERVLEYDFETLLCSHRGVVKNGYEAMRQKLKYLVAMREQVWYYQQQGDPLREICKRILGPEELISYMSLGNFSKNNYIKAFADEGRRLRLEQQAQTEPTWD